MHALPRHALSLIATAALLGACAAQAPGPSTAAATLGPTTFTATAPAIWSNPPGSELTLVWATGGAGTEMVDAIHLAQGPQGNIYVSSATPSGFIRVFDPDGKFLTAWGSADAGDGEFGFLLGIAADADGFVYAGDFERNRITKFTSEGTFVLDWATEQPIGPAGIAVDAMGNVYVVNHRAHEHMVQKFDSKGSLLGAWGSVGTGDGQIGAGDRGGPEDLAVDLQGNVYVADHLNDRVEKFDANGTYLATIGTPGSNGQGQLRGPFDVSVDGHGNVYVLEASYLQKFDADGVFVAQWSVLDGPLQNAGEVMADPDGNLYLDTSTILEKFSQ
jgi:DNA-binding beta-propeller fold protein YncE